MNENTTNVEGATGEQEATITIRPVGRSGLVFEYPGDGSVMVRGGVVERPDALTEAEPSASALTAEEVLVDFVDKLLVAFVEGVREHWQTAEQLEDAAQRIEALRPDLPSDEDVLAVVHAFLERVPAALRAAAQEPRP